MTPRSGRLFWRTWFISSSIGVGLATAPLSWAEAIPCILAVTFINAGVVTKLPLEWTE